MKLDGVTVIDLSMFLPGPHFTQMMADHGADVIRVEPHAGEPSRELGLKLGEHSVWFRNTHRGKRSLRLNLKDPRGKALLASIKAAWAKEAAIVQEAEAGIGELG